MKNLTQTSNRYKTRHEKRHNAVYGVGRTALLWRNGGLGGLGTPGLVLVGPDAGRVGEDVGDVGLLVRRVEEVGPGPLGEDGHVVAAVRLGVAGGGRRLVELEALQLGLVDLETGVTGIKGFFGASLPRLPWGHEILTLEFYSFLSFIQSCLTH